MKNNFFLRKYIGLTIVFFSLINLLGFINPFLSTIQKITNEYNLFFYIPICFGIFLSALVIMEFSKFEMHPLLFMFIVFIIIISYDIGITLLVIWKMVSTSTYNKSNENILDDT